ncbi:two component transcriptional regulator, winged helix family [Trichodesmium erythraeum IMS101]|uniref:Two component transcriptional regulator, winged helix family n=2 Tax=Trichodesmium erythraeum TaxID=1206 RepID=Q10ZN2_TRIEI
MSLSMSTLTVDQNLSVLIIETDETLAQYVSLDLQESGYNPIVANNSSNGFHRAMELQPALIVIDRMLAGESGLSLCSNLRKMGNKKPLLLLMASDQVEDRVACLESGADDYFLKPYRRDDFLQLIRFYLQPNTSDKEQLVFANLILDFASRRVFCHGRSIELTMKEFELLKFLMEHPREVLSREQILENVWGYSFLGESNVIEVYIRYLRLKIEREGEKRLIQTIRGIGYVLRET